MAAALGLAARGLGQVWPNPAVGCVLVRDGRVVGRGWTQPGGRPHAETEAIRRAGAAATGATAYVTLEPCAHHGKTPPCAEALIAAGVARVVVAIEDPDPRTWGKGIAKLQEAGIAVTVGVGAEAAHRQNEGFILRVKEGRPLFTLKAATSLDGRIATHTGHSQWITGDWARQAGHQLRADHDAILVGSGTAHADDPSLTCRLPGLELRSPVRIVADSRLSIDLTSKLVRTAREVPTWILARKDAPADRIKAFEGAGVVVHRVGVDKSGRLDLLAAARLLGEAGLTRVLVEGGGHLAAAFLQAKLIDRLAWFRAPRLIGGDGIAAVQGFGVDGLADTPHYAPSERRQAGVDLIETYYRDGG